MDTFLADAREIFDVARAPGNEGEADFALLIRPEGGLHLVMSDALLVRSDAFSLEALAAAEGANVFYRVTRGRGGVRLEGCRGNERCVLEERRRLTRSASSVPDEALYTVFHPNVISPLRRLAGSSCG